MKDKIKVFLGIATNETEHDFLIDMLVEQKIAEIETYLNRKLKEDIYTEVIDAAEYIYPKQTPIESVLSIEDEEKNEVEYSHTREYARIEKEKRKTLTLWPYFEEKRYTIKYKGGYAELPIDIQMIIIERVCISFREYTENTLGLASLNEGSVNRQFKERVNEQEIILDKYRIINI